jgi:hypothetical protein
MIGFGHFDGMIGDSMEGYNKLLPDTVYYVRAYATNTQGTVTENKLYSVPVMELFHSPLKIFQTSTAIIYVQIRQELIFIIQGEL